MSTYDDASLILIPSGVKAGKVYSAKPVPRYGAELVVGGDMSNSANWNINSNWSVTGGLATANGSSSADINQANNLPNVGTTYRVTYTITAYTSGQFKVAYGGVSTPLKNTIGTHVDDIVAVSTDRVRLGGVSPFGSVDNLSIKEVIGSGDFTFTRASEATRLVDGVVTKVRTNSILQSNDFSNVIWLKTSVTLTGGQADKDGGSNAWKFESQGSASYILQLTSISGVYTRSFYAKAGNVNWLSINSGGSQVAYFDVQNGVVGTTSSGAIDAKIEAAGNGWYRCSVIINSQSHFYLFVANADNSATTNSGDYILIQNAQLEAGLVATPYIATTTVAVSEGPVANMPRLNSVAGGCPSLLLEPQRTNSITQSEYFAAWIQFNTLNTSNALTSPEGVQNANKLIAASGVNNNVIYQGLSAGTYTASIFAKKGEFEGLVMATGTTGAFFNLNTNTYRTFYSNPPTSYKIEDYGNGWHRYSITFTEGGANNLYIGPNDNVSHTLGVTGNNSDGIYIYGAQMEAGSYATSYIPSYGTAATRVADVCSGAGTSATFNDSEGVLFVNTSALADDGTYRLISLVDASDAGQTFLDIGYRDTDNTVRARIEVSGVLSAGLQYTISDTTTASKIAFKYKANDFALWINGVEVDTDSSGGVFAAGILDELTFSKSGVDFYGNVNQVLYFPTALTDTELTTLTTL